MLRPELVAIALAFCVSGRPDCSPGTCQTLQPYFKCEFDGRGAAGGGNTIATANCDPGTDIVVRTSFQLPSHVDNGSQPLFFNRMEAFTTLQDLRYDSDCDEERFVLLALAYGFANDKRYLRRWIAKEEMPHLAPALILENTTCLSSCVACSRMPTLHEDVRAVKTDEIITNSKFLMNSSYRSQSCNRL